MSLKIEKTKAIKKVDIDGDLIISLKQSQGSLISPKMRVFVKRGGHYKQIGLIQDFELKANAEDVLVDCSVTFPKDSELSENTRKALQEYVELLIKFDNVKVNYPDHESRGLNRELGSGFLSQKS